MTRKEMIDYINNMEIDSLLKSDLCKYANFLYDSYFETYDRIKEGKYYNEHLTVVRECYIEYSTYLYALFRAKIIQPMDFYELEETAYNVYDILCSDYE